MPTVGEWLERWLAGRKTLRQGTVRAYRIHIRRWLVPQLGHLPLDKLTVEHVAAMFDTIAERNDEIDAARASDDPQIRASVRGLRTTGPAPCTATAPPCAPPSTPPSAPRRSPSTRPATSNSPSAIP